MFSKKKQIQTLTNLPYGVPLEPLPFFISTRENTKTKTRKYEGKNTKHFQVDNYRVFVIVTPHSSSYFRVFSC